MFVCELKKAGKGETFYRYEMDGNKVWFSQSDSGDIYSVSFAGNEKLFGIELAAVIEEIPCAPPKNLYIYPKGIYIITGSIHLWNPNEVDEYIEKLQYVKTVSEKAAEIFKLEEHLLKRQQPGGLKK